jgi:hypothetical protein
MNKAFRTFSVISLMIAVPSIVVAQSNTAFDGTYAGVSVTATGADSACKPFQPKPPPLTIRDGRGQFTAGSFVTGPMVFEGTASPQGDLRMLDMFARNLIGKIDSSGKATGTVTIADYGCVFIYVWQRQ